MNETAPQSAPTPPAAAASDDLGIDRAFLLQMAQVPIFGALFVLLGWLSTRWLPTVPFAGLPQFEGVNLGPVLCISVGMILSAIIDGWAFKVPNWLTLSLVVSGWGLGLLADFGLLQPPLVHGGVGAALLGTVLGFFLLFPMLFIGGMGQGDVKMQMGFGSWVAVMFGINAGLQTVFYAFLAGAIVGGVFGLVIMILRRQFGANASAAKEIVTDLQIMVTVGPKAAAQRANARRSSWVRLPYGVPLCVGFLGYLGYLYYFAG